jgi:hypothetical protein
MCETLLQRELYSKVARAGLNPLIGAGSTHGAAAQAGAPM